MNQPKDISELVHKAKKLHHPQTNTPRAPYRSGLQVDLIPDAELPQQDSEKLNKDLEELVDSLNWISTQTRPDIAIITK